MLVLVSGFAPAHLAAQALRLSSASANRGDKVTLELSLSSSGNELPQALQWDVTIPASQLSFLDHESQPGPAARGAGKALSCAPRSGSSGTVRCIMAGGLGEIPNGVVAMLSFTVRPAAKTGPTPVRIENAIAVLKGPREIPLPPAEAVVTVRP